MKSNVLRWLAIILILETGLLHILTAQAEYEEAAYMGYLFAANFLGTLLASFGIYHKQLWGWMLGLLIAAGSIGGYCWSRTVGMPGMNVEEWLTPYGVTALTVEGGFILLVLFRPWSAQSVGTALFHSTWRGSVMPVVSLALVVGMGLSTQQWDVAFKAANGHHVGTLSQVCTTPPTTLAELEENYGVQISLAATSMMGSIVDVRIKVIDTEKAHALLQNQAALLVDQQALILAPHMHSHTGGRLKAGKIFTIFFPTERMIVPGSQVSLVFGPVRVEPVTVK